MPLRFLLDEHIRRSVWTVIARHNLSGSDQLDAVRVGAAGGPPYGIQDAELLLWAQREGCVLLSEDKSTLPAHLAQHIASGNHSPGVMILRRRVHVADLFEFLYLASRASEPNEWENRIAFVP